jgi:3-dehydroquinate synthase
MVVTMAPQDSVSAKEIKYYEFDEVKSADILEGVRAAVRAGTKILANESSPDAKLQALLADSSIQSMLITVSRLPVFSKEMGRAFQDDLELLRILKQLKYFWNLPKSQLAILLEQVARQTCNEQEVAPFSDFQRALAATPEHKEKIKDMAQTLNGAQTKYRDNAVYLEEADPHAVYPTSIYRQCDALTLATPNASTIEAVMSTSITTTIKITRNVLDTQNRLLYDVYKPLGRCVSVIDDKVEAIYGTQIDKYFATHGIEYVKLVYSGNEADKDIRDVENILVDMKRNAQARNEPLLVIGGGVISDIAGFAAALYSRNTPYMMLCTSIVSGIDAGPSPRTCCNGFDYKNLYGAYHPPVMTLTDRGLWKSLHRGWLRHGIAEIIKMAVVEDKSLFELLEKWGPTLVQTKFGTEGERMADSAFQDECDLIVGKAMEGYVRSEYGNLWETHQCRPHAYGHTWSPGYELPAGMLHGHAVATCMGLGAYLAFKEGFISEHEMQRIHKLISDCELTLYHPVMDDPKKVWKAHLAMVEKRGGNLCAPVPKPLGRCGYINDISKKQLELRLEEYKVLCATYPRSGMGIEAHCTDVGLEDPQSKKENPMKAEEDQFVVTPSDRAVVSLARACACCRSDKKARANLFDAKKVIEGTDVMCAKYSTQPSADLHRISLATAKTNPLWKTAEEQGTTSRLMEAEMISGQVEGQLLQLLVRFGNVKKALDIGTFTGYSALALAEALPNGGSLVTLEREASVAKMATSNWSGSSHASKIKSLVGEAPALLKKLAAENEHFDLVFLDVDKPGYLPLYEQLMETGLLPVGGLLVVDNTMYKGEELLGQPLSANGKGAQDLNQRLIDDNRVSQVMLPLRDGVTLVHRVGK